MTNKKAMTRIIICATVFIAVIAMAVSACLVPDVTVPAAAANSNITLLDKEIENDLEQFIDSSVMYKLPDTVSDTDEISVIIKTNKTSLLDAYEKSDMSVSFTEYAYSADAEKVSDSILEEKNSIRADFDGIELDYTTGADYRAIFGGFEVVIKAGDFEALCKTLVQRYLSLQTLL